MSLKSLLYRILRDESLTRGLGDAEARLLVEWLVDRIEKLSLRDESEAARLAVDRLCRGARSLARFVEFWCYREDHAAACQLAATERFPWPLPAGPVDAWDLMHQILNWKDDSRRHRLAA